jgi:hypothetical protein
MEDIDIYRSAKLYVGQFGADASIHAALRVDALAEAGDVRGVATWKRVLRAIEELGATEGTRH